MALSNYTELKASIADYLNRSDLTAAIPDFISLTEAKLKRRYKDFSPLSSSNANNWILTSYPDVYLYGALLEASPYLVEDERVSVWAQLYAAAVGSLRGTVGNADFDDYDGLKLAVGDWLARADLDGVVPQLIKLGEAKLFRKFDGVTALSSSNTTNFILTNHPDLYLYASLSEAAPYLGQDDRLGVWRDLYAVEVARVRKPKDGVLLTTYDGLKAAIADWLERYDIDSVIPRFIELAEVQLNQDVRHYHMENRANADLDSQYLQRPSDWLETIRFHLTGSGTQNLEYLSAASMADKRQGSENAVGKPKFYRHAERGFEVFPTPDATYQTELLYYQKIPALDAQNASNWVLENYPDAYVYGSLIHAAPYLGDDARAATWAGLYATAIQRINNAAQSQYSGSGLKLKVRGLG
tara:strand:- start:5022 stop:6254 length:1233 start_codon:yes stop_codon:yes gene_type:complete